MPNGDEIRIETGVGFGVRKFTQRIELVHGEASGSRMTGIYRCDMPTTAVNDVGNTARESVYVGLYAVNSESSITHTERYVRPYTYIPTKSCMICRVSNLLVYS